MKRPRRSSGSEALDSVCDVIAEYIVCSPDQRVAATLWVMHTHALEAAECTPYLAILSAERRSGKSLLLEVVGLFVPRPLVTANITEAALFRVISAEMPVLLWDEIDSIFGSRAREREELRGLLNAGFRRGQSVHRMGGPQKTTLEKFDVFCPKALAGLGRLPETISDRSITVMLKRKAPEEITRRFRRRIAEAESAGLAERLSSWAEANIASLREARPEIPAQLDDRAADAWEPLLAIADAVGGEWPDRARMSALALSGPTVTKEESIGVQLLEGIRSVFKSTGSHRIPSQKLVDRLKRIEGAPWSEWRGNGLTPNSLARILKRYEIRPLAFSSRKRRVFRGYSRDQFDDVFKRYLPSLSSADGTK